MGKELLLIIAINVFKVVSAPGQIMEGEIVYELKVDLHRNIPEERSALKDRIPPFRTSQHLLLFNEEESIYRIKQQEESRDETSPGQNRGFRFRMGGRENNEIYKSLKDQTAIHSTEIFGKKFLVTGAAPVLKWKMTTETKQVGDYLCQKAIFKDSIRHIEVWFTPMIPVSIGPEIYGGLPGAILYANINEGERVITAQEIIPKEIESALIIKPTEGEKVTREEFEKIRAEKMEEMRQNGGGRRLFRRRTGG